MRAVVLREVGRPTVVEELTLRPVARHEVAVQLAASGVCHTDLSVRDGDMPALLPCTLGHEGAGIVTEVGADVDNRSPRRPRRAHLERPMPIVPGLSAR